MHLLRAVLPAAVLSLSAFTARAQFRIFGGPQLTGANYTVQEANQPTERRQGFMAGIGLTTAVEENFFFSPSLYYSQKGFTVTYNRPSVPPDADARNNEVSLQTVAFAPLLQVNLAKGKSTVFFRFGPAIEVGVAGRERFDSAGIKTVDRNLRFSATAYSRAFFETPPDGFAHASELVGFIRERFGQRLSLAGAAYPEGHIECRLRE